MMANPSYDPPSFGPWVWPECLHKNKDYHQCMGPDCNSVMPGGMFNTSQFAASNQLSSNSRCTNISVAMNHPAAAATHGRGKGTASMMPPPSSTRVSAACGKDKCCCKYYVSFLSESSHGTSATSSSRSPLISGCPHYPVPDVDRSPRATPCCTLFLDESSANGNDSMHSSVLGILLGEEGLVNSPHFSENNDMIASLPTDNEVSKYSFYSHLSHYMEGHKIGETNCASVELCILSEAGAFVCNIDQMKKDKKEKAFLAKYESIINEIEDEEFEDSLVRNNMRQRYKGAKKDNNGQSLWQKYKTELTDLHMKKPLVQALWTAKYLVQFLLCCY
jgi:hypothetical protein